MKQNTKVIIQEIHLKMSSAERRPSCLSSLQWRHNELDCVSNHRRLAYLLNRLFRHRSKKTSKLRVTGLCEGNPPLDRWFPPQRASNAENVSIWWRHHVYVAYLDLQLRRWQIQTTRYTAIRPKDNDNSTSWWICFLVSHLPISLNWYTGPCVVILNNDNTPWGPVQSCGTIYDQRINSSGLYEPIRSGNASKDRKCFPPGRSRLWHGYM